MAPDGTIRIWDPATREFGVYTPEEQTRTYFDAGRTSNGNRPPGKGERYWEKQTGEDPWSEPGSGSGGGGHGAEGSNGGGEPGGSPGGGEPPVEPPVEPRSNHRSRYRSFREPTPSAPPPNASGEDVGAGGDLDGGAGGMRRRRPRRQEASRSGGGRRAVAPRDRDDGCWALRRSTDRRRGLPPASLGVSRAGDLCVCGERRHPVSGVHGQAAACIPGQADRARERAVRDAPDQRQLEAGTVIYELNGSSLTVTGGGRTRPASSLERAAIDKQLAASADFLRRLPAGGDWQFANTPAGATSDLHTDSSMPALAADLLPDFASHERALYRVKLGIDVYLGPGGTFAGWRVALSCLADLNAISPHPARRPALIGVGLLGSVAIRATR